MANTSFYDAFVQGGDVLLYHDTYFDDACDDNMVSASEIDLCVSRITSRMFARVVKYAELQEEIDRLVNDGIDFVIGGDDDDDDGFGDMVGRFSKGYLGRGVYEDLIAFKDNITWLIKRIILQKRRKCTNGEQFYAWLKTRSIRTTISGDAYVHTFYSVARRFGIRWYKNENKKKSKPKTKKKSNIRTAKQMRACALLDPSFQSGDKSADKAGERAAKRAEREAFQRKCARKRAAAEHKLRPKDEREREILVARDKRTPTFEDPEFQSGDFTTAAVVGTTLTVGVGLGYALSVLYSKVSVSVDESNELLRQLNELAQMLRKALGSSLWYIPLLACAWYSIKGFGLSNTINFTLVSSALAIIVGKDVWNAVSDFFRAGDLCSADDGVEFQGSASNIAAELLTVLVTFAALGRKPDARTVTEFTKRIALFDRTKVGFDGFVTWLITSMETLINAIMTYFGKDKVDFLGRANNATLRWLEEVDRTALIHNTASAPANIEEINRIIRLMNEGLAYKDAYRLTPMGRTVEEANARLTNILMPHLGAINARNNFRQEPILMCLLGDSGIGKTLMAVPLCATVLIASGLVKEANFDEVCSNIWQKGLSEFWNSYSHQSCVVLDDAFQQRVDKANQDNEFMNIIRMVSSWAYPLNMADLASKGKIFFGSKFIFATTNMISIQAEANSVLHEPLAVARRINYGYRLILKPEYARRDVLSKGTLDMEKFEIEYKKCEGKRGLDGFPWYIWTVRKHDFITGVSSNEEKPLVDLIREVINAMRDRSANFTASEDKLKSYVAGLSTLDFQSGFSIKQYFCGASSSFQSSYASVFKRLSDEFSRDVALVNKFVEKTFANSTALLRTALVTATIAAVAYGVYRLFGNKEESKVIIEPINWQSNRPVKGKPSTRESFPVFQGGDISVHKNIYANSYKLFWKEGEDLNVAGQVLFIESTLAAMPAHFTRRFREKLERGVLSDDTALVFRHVNNMAHTFSMKLSTFLKYERVALPDHDVEFVNFTDSRAHRSITRNFLTEQDLKYLDGSSIIMALCDVADGSKMLQTPRERFWSIPRANFIKNLSISGNTVQRVMSYTAPTQPGDCGAPVCLMDSNHFSGRTCFGVHIAGDRAVNRGFSTIVTQAMIEKAKKELGVITDNFVEDIQARGVSFQISDEEAFENMGSFLPIGLVDKPNHLARKSKLFPFEEVFGKFGESNDRPAPLRPVFRDGELVYPMVKAVEPYSSPVFIIENEIVDLAVHVAMRKFGELSHGLPRNIYSFEEACVGVPQHKMRSLPRGTSAGYPYTQEVTNGKKMFFGDGDDFDFSSPLCAQLKERVEHIIHSASEGVRLCHVFADFLKDELRSPEKVEAVKTRLISSAPIDYTIAFRMYFGAFSSAMMRTNTNSGLAPGICTYTDWYIAAMFLQQKGDKVFDGDFKAFDASEQPGLMVRILNYINDWYDDGPQNALVRRVLWEDLCHSRHIGGKGDNQRYIYQWNKSLPSGHPFTTCINSIYSLVVLVTAYMHITKDWTGFWDKVHALTYGDDNVVNVSDDVCHEYNQVTVAGAIKELFGMIYTPGRKDGVWNPYQKIFDITFLKRGFVLEDGTWLCPLELESALYCAYWGRNRRDVNKNMFDNLEFTLRELAHHTTGVWNKYVPLIKGIYDNHGKQPTAPFKREAYRFLTLNEPDRYY